MVMVFMRQDLVLTLLRVPRVISGVSLSVYTLWNAFLPCTWKQLNAQEQAAVRLMSGCSETAAVVKIKTSCADRVTGQTLPYRSQASCSSHLLCMGFRQAKASLESAKVVNSVCIGPSGFGSAQVCQCDVSASVEENSATALGE